MKEFLVRVYNTDDFDNENGFLIEYDNSFTKKIPNEFLLEALLYVKEDFCTYHFNSAIVVNNDTGEVMVEIERKRK